MKIAVITPVYQPNRSWLNQCLASVRAQTIPCTHFLVNDGDDSLQEASFPGAEIFRLPRPHLDHGNTARAIGSMSAMALGFDAVAYLDPEHWLEPDHLRQLVELQRRTGAAVCTAGRNLVDLEGRLLGPCFEVDGVKYADTKAGFFTRTVCGMFALWQRMPWALSAVGDGVVWRAIQDEKLPHAHNPAATVNFRTRYAAHYRHFGKAVPAGAKHVSVQKGADGQLVATEVLSTDFTDYTD